MSVIAHSFGTYAIARILLENPDIVFHHAVFCGSIVPKSYRWDYVRERLQTGVLNDYGTRDIWPVLAKCLSWGYGDTGRHGFGRGATVIDRGHDYSHSDFFNEQFVRNYWEPWFAADKFVPSRWEEKAPPTPWCLSILSLLPLQWVLCVLIGLAIAFWPLGVWERLLRPARSDAITFEQMADDHASEDFVAHIDEYRAAHLDRQVEWDAIIGERVPGGYYVFPVRSDLREFRVLAKYDSIDDAGALREGTKVKLRAVVDDINPASVRLKHLQILQRPLGN
ncbi:MAG TPA: hypothetical protein VHC22_21810 [Pirellulales bacterium]|nr:hypothetical protein [Pirellulales bacterium]